MIMRREVVLGGLLTVVTASSDACCQPLNSPGRPSGCMIPETLAPAFFANSSTPQLIEAGNEKIVQRSGDDAFDYALAQTLSSITATLGVLPGFAYFDDGDKPRAFATSATRLGRSHGTVLFGTRLRSETLAERDHSDLAAAAVCAHEYGHILQMKIGADKVLGKGQATVKRVELHADFLAGYYAGVRKLEKDSRKESYPAAVFVTKLSSMGDMPVDHPDHHGTPAERARAIQLGFKTAYSDKRALADAIDIGMNYVLTL